jgi:hypothetical protein
VSKKDAREVEREEWERAVGAFVIAMGEIEGFVDGLVWLFVPADAAKVIGWLDLRKRIDAVRDLTKGKQLQKSDVLADALKRAEDLLPDRNIVAHRSPVADIYIDPEGELHELVSRIVGRKGRHVDLVRLRTLRKEAHDVGRALFDVWMAEEMKRKGTAHRRIDRPSIDR